MLLSFHWFWLVALLCLVGKRLVEAQFPQACTTPEVLENRICCPMFQGSPCGLKANRGVCAAHSTSGYPRPPDYRINWPSEFYDSVCTCYGNYDGFDCGQCKPGWTGSDCLTPHQVVRKEITDMSESERQSFFESLQKAKETISTRYKILTSSNTSVKGNFEFHEATIYDLYVWLHFYAAKSYPWSHNNNAAHKGPAFPFWHRVFLLFIEREIRDLTGNLNFYIPYWDWTRYSYCNICNNRYFGASNQNGHINHASNFSRWQLICPYSAGPDIICSPATDDSAYLLRQPGNDPSCDKLPTKDAVIETLALAVYDTPPYNTHSKNSFRNMLEGFEMPRISPHLVTSMHNLVHDYLNGTVSIVEIAANDPIFMTHHSFVDKLLDIWLKEHPHASYPDSDLIFPPQRANANMAPFFPLRTNSYYWNLRVENLGYFYQDHSIPVP